MNPFTSGPPKPSENNVPNRSNRTAKDAKISIRTVGRLSLYRRLLSARDDEASKYIYSHELAAMSGGTAVQVRRDLMALGCTGNTAKGYSRAALVRRIGRFLDDPNGVNVALVGIGNLGRAILAFFAGQQIKLTVVAAFDKDPAKAGKVIHGCRCYRMDQLKRIAKQKDIRAGIIAVPVEAGPEAARQLAEAGVTGILNFAPVRLGLEAPVHVQDIDITTALETTAYFARKPRKNTRKRRAPSARARA